MGYVTPQDAFHGYAHAIIIGIYTDKITASAVKKENNTAIVVATAMEPVEGITSSDAVFPAEKVVFNMEKAIAALPQETRSPGTVVILALGPGSGICAYAIAEGKREVKDRKITAEEMRAISDAVHAEKGNTYALYPEHFSIDGFSVSDPVGLNGGEIVVGMVRVSSDGVSEKEYEARIGALGYRYGGMIDMRYAAMHADHFFENTTRALLVFVFEHEMHSAIMHEKAVHAIGMAHTGYGILYADIARVFAVGMEEAKEIVRAYRKQELNNETRATVADICASAAQKIVDAAKETIMTIDSASIIPGQIHVVCADTMPEVSAQFISHDWFADLPMERNASVSLFSEEKYKGFITPFDHVCANFVTRHH